MEILILLIKFLYVPLISPFCIGVIRKIKAYMQNRKGASVFQPYRDLVKLFRKDEAISSTASWIFMYTPYILFAITLLVSLGLPFLTTGANLFGINDFLVIIYLFTFASFFLAMAGIDTASSFGGFGSSREMTVLALTEGGLLFSFLPIAILTHTTNLNTMTSVLSSIPLIQYVPVAVAFVAFFIALLAENARIPVDNPSTHLELTMIHEAMILEYSGKRLALIEWSSFNKLVIFSILGANLFFPWSISTNSNYLGIFMTLVFVFVKVLIIVGFVAMVESTIAKLRFFRLPDLMFTSFILGVISLFLVII
jgi:formate hydrogenlyase subunit 4